MMWSRLMRRNELVDNALQKEYDKQRLEVTRLEQLINAFRKVMCVSYSRSSGPRRFVLNSTSEDDFDQQLITKFVDANHSSHSSRGDGMAYVDAYELAKLQLTAAVQRLGELYKMLP